jgi:hypothetical protein
METLKFMTPTEIIQRIENGERDFSNIKTYGLELLGKNVDGIIFKNSEFEAVRFRGSSLVGADFSGVKMNIGGFVADISKANFKNTKLNWVAFMGTKIDDADFTRSDIRNSVFLDNNFSAAKFNETTLINVIKSWDEVTEEDVNKWTSIWFSIEWPKSTKLFFRTQLQDLKTRFLTPFRAIYLSGKRFFKSRESPEYSQRSKDMIYGNEMSSVYSSGNVHYGNRPVNEEIKNKIRKMLYK